MTIKVFLIYYLLTSFIAIVFLKIYAKNENKKIILNAKNILKICSMSLLTLINNIFNFKYLRLIITDVLMFITLKWFYKDTNKKTLYYTVIICLTTQILELISAIFLPLWIKNIDMLNNNLYMKAGLSIILNIIMYFILTNHFIMNFLKKIKNAAIRNKIFYVIVIIGFLTCNIWLLYVGENIADKMLNIIITVTEMIIIILLIITLKNTYEKNISKIKEEQLKQNLNLYSKIAQEYKELKHNLMNDFLAIKTKIPKKDQKFINDIIIKYKSNYEWVSNISDIPEGLQGLVFLKKNQAEIKKITFNIEYNTNKNINSIFDLNNNFKLYETLGILFDNAIEGASESKEKIINVLLSYNNKSFKISIYNTFNNDIDLDKIGTKDYSTKNRGSGIGLNYIKKQKNKFVINQIIQENIFITTIIINSKEKK